MYLWASAQSGLTVNYQAVGSGAGITALESKILDFVASDPPLTQDMMDLYCTAMDYVLDLHMTDGQRDEYQRIYIETWKKQDPKESATNIETWRQPLSGSLSGSAYDRRVWRARQRRRA